MSASRESALTRHATVQAIQLAAYELYEGALRARTAAELEAPMMELVFASQAHRLTEGMAKDLFYRLHEIGDAELIRLRTRSTPIGRTALPEYVNMFEHPHILDSIKHGNYVQAIIDYRIAFNTATHMFNTQISRHIYGGSALGIAAVGMSAYEIATSSNPLDETLHQGTLIGGGLFGGFEAGSLAVGACAAAGPYAPVCVAAATFAGCIAGTEVAELIWSASKSLSVKLSEVGFSVPSFIGRAHASEDLKSLALAPYTIPVCIAASSFGQSLVTPTKVETVETSKLTCQVSTMPDGARIAKCSVKNIESLAQSRQSFFSATSKALHSPDLSRLSATSRPSITYTDMLSRQTALANGPFMFSSFCEPPPRFMPSGQGFFSRDSGGGGYTYCDSSGCYRCDSSGSCYSVGSGSRSDCHQSSGSSTCKSTLF